MAADGTLAEPFMKWSKIDYRTGSDDPDTNMATDQRRMNVGRYAAPTLARSNLTLLNESDLTDQRARSTPWQI